MIRQRLHQRAAFLAALTLGILLLGSAPAKAEDLCEVCREKATGQAYFLEDAYHKRNRVVCKACSEITTRCLVCGFPVHPKFGLHLPDLRAYCEEDAKTAVMTENAATDLFEKARQEVTDILAHYPPLPRRTVRHHLVTREEFNRQYRQTPGIEDPGTLLGLTISRTRKEGEIEHDIYLLHGVPQDEFLAVCAHEYTHTWLNERQKPVRQLHKDTQEGVCELIAHKVTGKFRLELETRRILESPYTRGQVAALLAAEKEYELYRLVQWITDGVDSWVDGEDLSRVLILREKQDEALPPFNWMPVKQPPVPDTLVLKGLSGTGHRRYALINNATLEAGEEARVRVGMSNVLVRCLTIAQGAVTIQVSGEVSPRQLRLGTK
jgi:hypothetical protein